MQAACWFGRKHSNQLQKKQVSAHLYVEFESKFIDVSRLQIALEKLHKHHELLRLGLTLDGVPYINTTHKKPLLEIEDLRDIKIHKQQKILSEKRHRWTHQQLDVQNAEVAKFSLTIFGDDNFRLHIDTDMIAIDPSSLRILLEDLATFYKTPEQDLAKSPSFFDWFNELNHHVDFKKKMAIDKAWWQSKLDSITPAPTLPISSSELNTSKSERLFTYLSADLLNQLSSIAKRQGITLTTCLLSLFAISLHSITDDRQFRISVPVFWRNPIVENVNYVIGDFANFIITDFTIDINDCLSDFFQKISEQMIERIGHSHYTGVNIMRDLSRHKQSIQLAPIVFTSAVDLLEGNLYSKNVKDVFGSMIWSVSEAPETALDVQLVKDEGQLLINWDVRLDKIPLNWVTRLFNYFVELLLKIANNPNVLQYKISDVLSLVESKPLTALQRSYLMGRTYQLPLGGVAMQEVREYRGRMDASLLKNRLLQMVKNHDGLRTYINEHTLTQSTYKFVESALKKYNLTEVYIEDLSVNEADNYINQYIQEYSHALFDLTYSPWNISIFYRAEKELTVLTRFDALILDGRAISKLLVELFTNKDDLTTENFIDNSKIEPIDRLLQKNDKAYWVNKLAEFIPLSLPYTASLKEIKQSIFERESCCVSKETTQKLFNLSTKNRLFKNSIILALVLDTISQLTSQPMIYAAVPVLPAYTSKFSNNSTFIVVSWHANQLDLLQQAKQLQIDILEGMDHLNFSGVDLARYLVNKTGSIPTLPLVITNGLSWDNLPNEHPMKFRRGLTQTPQIILDIRFSLTAAEELLFDIDYVGNALNSSTIINILDKLNNRIHTLTAI